MLQRIVFLLCLVSLWVTGCSQESHVEDAELAIVAVLYQDWYMAGWVKSDNPDLRLKGVARIKKIDLHACPPEFRRAYTWHATAWEKDAKETVRLLSRFNTNGVVTPEVSAALDPAINEEINASWAEVKRIAEQYGVDASQW